MNIHRGENKSETSTSYWILGVFIQLLQEELFKTQTNKRCYYTVENTSWKFYHYQEGQC